MNIYNIGYAGLLSLLVGVASASPFPANVAVDLSYENSRARAFEFYKAKFFEAESSFLHEQSGRYYGLESLVARDDAELLVNRVLCVNASSGVWTAEVAHLEHGDPKSGVFLLGLGELKNGVKFENVYNNVGVFRHGDQLEKISYKEICDIDSPIRLGCRDGLFACLLASGLTVPILVRPEYQLIYNAEYSEAFKKASEYYCSMLEGPSGGALLSPWSWVSSYPVEPLNKSKNHGFYVRNIVCVDAVANLWSSSVVMKGANNEVSLGLGEIYSGVLFTNIEFNIAIFLSEESDSSCFYAPINQFDSPTVRGVTDGYTEAINSLINAKKASRGNETRKGAP